MKIILFICVGLVMLGCTDERSAVIADYIQTTGNVKTDMSFSLVEIVDLGDVYGRDSLAIIKLLYAAEKERKIDYENDNIKDYEELSEDVSEIIKDYKTDKSFVRYYGAGLKSKIDEQESILAGFQANIKSSVDIVTKLKNDSIPWINGFERMKVGRLYQVAKRYEANKDVVFARKAKATYSIKNPLFHNAKQEVTTTFVFSPDNTKILGVI